MAGASKHEHAPPPPLTAKPILVPPSHTIEAIPVLQLRSIWILVQEVQNPSWTGAVEPALRCLLQNLFLFGSSLLFRVVRTGAEQ